ncbi:hypothetical protein CY35_06G094400 [Sphagnum magellanicum]|nr:hypothetical protein CY35_06G094400 [Sphagnum magellanicum]
MAMVSAVALTMACVCPAATVVAQSAAASCSGLFAGETSLGKVLLLPHHPFRSIGVSCNTLFMAAPLLDCSNSRLGRRETNLQGRFSRRFAKFQQFNQGADTSAVNLSQEEHEEQEEEAEEDEEVEDERLLPEDLWSAVIQSCEASASFINSGGTRAIVELLVPALENLNDDGAQQRLWDLARLYLDTLQEKLGDQRLKAIFPDAGSAALVKYQWEGAPFSFGSLNDRRPISNDDDVVILILPDHESLSAVENIADILAGDDDTPARPMIMWNPRLISGDVGIGLNVRRLRERLLNKCTTVYHLRPLGTMTIFRKYPGLWQVFLDDVKRPGHLILAKEQSSRPSLDQLDTLILSGGESEAAEQPSAFVKAVGVFNSLNRFMRSLSK